MSEAVAIIPARGGSKGIKRKNLQRVGGVPLVARAIVAAQRCGEIDRVVVSTDDSEIAAVSEEWGAEVVRRPADLAGDQASSESALTHALGELQERGVDVGVIAFLQATSPFIDVEALAGAVRTVRSPVAERSCRVTPSASWVKPTSAVPRSTVPPWRCSSSASRRSVVYCGSVVKP